MAIATGSPVADHGHRGFCALRVPWEHGDGDLQRRLLRRLVVRRLVVRTRFWRSAVSGDL
jgi:hypothetical protein